MLSLLPFLFDYEILAITALRITLGGIFVWFAYAKVFRERVERIAFFDKIGLSPAVPFFIVVTGIEFVAGVLLIIGLFTQGATLAVGALMTLAMIIKWRTPDALPRNTIEFYILLAIVSFSLLFFGPGIFAFDLPL